MLLSTLLPLLPLAANAINVVQSNDDGWAEINIRQFYDSLTDAGFSSLISAPALNQSGKGSMDEKPMRVDSNGCEFMSCPPNSPAIGRNKTMPRFNYVNSYPVTSMRYGIQKASKRIFGKRPDIAVAGPNVGSNLGIVTQLSGTVGATVEAIKLGIPGIAFSSTTGDQTAWTAPVEPYMQIYASLSTLVTQTLTSTKKPYLPRGIWLNVNYPAVDNSSCSTSSDFKFVLSRIYPAVPFVTPNDVNACGGNYLPTEQTVVGTDGCYASISVANVSKMDATASQQAVVLKKLNSILTCLPSSSGVPVATPTAVA